MKRKLAFLLWELILAAQTPSFLVFLGITLKGRKREINIYKLLGKARGETPKLYLLVFGVFACVALRSSKGSPGSALHMHKRGGESYKGDKKRLGKDWKQYFSIRNCFINASNSRLPRGLAFNRDQSKLVVVSKGFVSPVVPRSF